MTRHALKEKRVRARRKFAEEVRILMKGVLPEGSKIEMARPRRNFCVQDINFISYIPGKIHSTVVTGSVE